MQTKVQPLTLLRYALPRVLTWELIGLVHGKDKFLTLPLSARLHYNANIESPGTGIVSNI